MFWKRWKIKYFMIENDVDVLTKHNKIWSKIKKTWRIKFHSQPVYDKKYIKVKVEEFNGAVNINLLDNKMPKKV